MHFKKSWTSTPSITEDFELDQKLIRFNVHNPEDKHLMSNPLELMSCGTGGYIEDTYENKAWSLP